MSGRLEIIELEVSDFNRLALSDNKAITINPKTNVHLLLGTNGSGKSSLMELMILQIINILYIRIMK